MPRDLDFDDEDDLIGDGKPQTDKKRAHARLSPSSAHRWLRCPGSVRLADTVDEDRSSVYAAEGTVAHHVRESCLMFGFDPEDFLGDEITADGFTFTVGLEMVEALKPGIEWIRERPGRVVNEFRVGFDRWLPGQFGTLDVGIIDRRLITINDLKYGAGVPVHPERNEQLMTYALGFWDNVARHETKATEFLLVIDQPRANGGGGEWRTNLEELLEFGERLKVGYENVHAEDPYFKAGDKQCRFCPAKGFCPELARYSLAQMQLAFDDLEGDELTFADVASLTPMHRARIAQEIKVMKSWLDAVHAKVVDDALSGRPTPGLKVVAGRKGDRKWVDEKAAIKYLGKYLDFDEMFTEPVLLSPAEAEKALPKDARAGLSDHTVQSDGKPSLVDESDPKPALASVIDQFDDE